MYLFLILIGNFVITFIFTWLATPNSLISRKCEHMYDTRMFALHYNTTTFSDTYCIYIYFAHILSIYNIYFCVRWWFGWCDESALAELNELWLSEWNDDECCCSRWWWWWWWSEPLWRNSVVYIHLLRFFSSLSAVRFSAACCVPRNDCILCVCIYVYIYI